MKPKTKLMLKELAGNMAFLSGCPVPTTHPCAITKFGNQFEWARQRKFPFVKVKKRV